MRPFRRIENKRSRRPDLGGTNSRLHKSEYGTQEGTRSTNAGPTAEVRYGSQSDTLAARLPESCSCSSSRFNKSAVMGIELLVSDRTAVVPAELRSLTEFVPGCVGCIVGCQRQVEMSYSRQVEMSYSPAYANAPFPSSENVFRTARSCQGRAVLARRSEPLTASTVLTMHPERKGGCLSALLPFQKRTFLLCCVKPPSAES